MSVTAKALVYMGVFLVMFGLIWEFGGKFLHLGRLPGDIVIEKENFKLFFPITTSILISILGSSLFYIARLFSEK